MTDSDSAAEEASAAEQPPRWQPLGAIERRIIGVLAEKAKTTPDAYPMSLNAITTGCNQKSNRFPMMQLEPDDVEAALESLRNAGAVGMIEGYGRVAKYRHYLYDWLGVDKVELAVMAELLLRGAQTEGELRGRAARMEPIADLGALRPLLDSLRAKNLLISLTPEGRGHVVSHNLYKPRELEHLRTQFAGGSLPAAAGGDAGPAEPVAASRAAVASPAAVEESETMRRELEGLRALVIELQDEFHRLADRQQQTDDAVHQLRSALGG